jgi:hypothetical protein
MKTTLNKREDEERRTSIPNTHAHNSLLVVATKKAASCEQPPAPTRRYHFSLGKEFHEHQSYFSAFQN